MITFKVDNVKLGKPLEISKEKGLSENLKSLIGLGAEASSMKSGITYGTNNFMAAVNTAYDRHLPLTISPDMLWLVIAQGLALHINNNAEELRHQFVAHEGKEKLEVFENAFIKGSADNNWEHTFSQWSGLIKEYIGKKKDLIVGEYSTTGSIETAANEIVLMEAMQQYFSYVCHTCCGIPEITLLGTKEDWQSIKTRVHAMSEFNLSWWTNKLEPIVDEFINAASGKENVSFWQKIYKEDGGSGGPFVSGWSIQLFPYLKNNNDSSKFTKKNEFLDSWRSSLTTTAFPIGLSKVPFVWNYYAEKFNMELAAGFTGFSFENDSVTPNIGWAVRDIESEILIKANYEQPESIKADWDKQTEMRNDFVSKLEAFGFEVNRNRGWGNKIYGSIPKVNFEKVKGISGLEISLWDQTNNRD